MKKGFTMIELIFVIVILGILASVAIPRLAATREDAEISAAVANLRTLVSDATAYYTAKGEFVTTGTAKAKWSEITNVPLTAKEATKGATGTDGQLKVGGIEDCIAVRLVDRPTNNNTPAHIVFAKKSNPTGVCAQVLAAEPLKPYFDSRVNGVNDKSAIAIGSSTSVYTSTAPATTQQPSRQ